MLAAVPEFKHRSLGDLDIVAHRPKFLRLVEDMSLGYMSYGELARLLQDEAAEIMDVSAAVEVYRKLLLGMADELLADARLS